MDLLKKAPLLVAASVIVTFAVAVGTASARRMEASAQGGRAVWTTATFEAVGITIRCPVTIEGTLHSRTISKVSGELVGYITRAMIASERCEGGTARVLAETLPWHVQYVSFTGTLPSITAITSTVVGAAIAIEVLGTTCLYRTTQSRPAKGQTNLAGGIATTVTAEAATRIPSLSGGFCPEGGLAGSGTVTVLGSTTTRIAVRLVA